MIVKIKTKNNNSNSNNNSEEQEEEEEWFSVEFQGDLLPGNNDDNLLGIININGNSATLTLDYQLLYGQVISLDKPLLVTDVQEDSMLQVIAIVSKKILFNSRPQPRIE